MRIPGFVFLLLAVAASAAPLQRDLGQGLLLHRAQELPRDLPDGARNHALVLDVRYAAGDRRAGAVFQGWLKFQTGTRNPVFVLANTETAPAVRAALHDVGPLAGLIVVGIPASNFRPDVAVTSTPENERRAYQALQNGVPVFALLADNPNKVRNDEASLSRDRLAEAAADSVADATQNGSPPPVDATLQRAVHLHRALLALKKL